MGLHSRGGEVPSRGATSYCAHGAQRLLSLRVRAMNVKYFKDTGTALLEFSDAEVEETREISENAYVDLDKSGILDGLITVTP